MKIQFLGTGAADWGHAKEKDDRYYRRYSSVLIDGMLLIDPGPKVLEAIEEFAIDITKIRFIIVTHKHPDHYAEETVRTLMASGSQMIAFDAEETKSIGPYQVKAVKGNHSVATRHYIISDGSKKLFYGMDGAWLLYDEIQAIKESAPIDLAIFDATIGFRSGDYRVFEHNNLSMVIEMKESLAAYIDQFCISHMAFTLHDSHPVLAKQMEEQEIMPAYDGLVVEL